MELDFRRNRERMLKEQIQARGISAKLVIEAMAKVRRHYFVEEALYSKAYEDYPLPVGFGQTISQPYVVALMSELLESEPGMRILEIGTGSGYQAAILAEMRLEVYSVERIKELYLRTKTLLQKLKYFKIRLKLDDGTLGWEEQAPFERIIVTAGGPVLPAPLLDQLADPGILLIPLGEKQRIQKLIRVRKQDGQVWQEDLGSVSFVNLVGQHGW